MHIIREEEERDYALFMDKVAYCGYLESGKAVAAMNKTTFDELRPAAQAIGMAVGQIILDKVIALTENMDKETIVRYLAQVSFSHTVEVMNACPEYREKIKVLGPFLDHL